MKEKGDSFLPSLALALAAHALLFLLLWGLVRTGPVQAAQVSLIDIQISGGAIAGSATAGGGMAGGAGGLAAAVRAAPRMSARRKPAEKPPAPQPAAARPEVLPSRAQPDILPSQARPAPEPPAQAPAAPAERSHTGSSADVVAPPGWGDQALAPGEQNAGSGSGGRGVGAAVGTAGEGIGPAGSETGPGSGSGAAQADINPMPVRTIEVAYPAAAKTLGQEGTVRILAEVSEDGAVTADSVFSSSGHRLLDSAALDAVRKVQFLPALKNGRRVAARIIVPIRFHLTE